MRRYEIQVVDTEDIKRKHSVVWDEVQRFWTLNGATEHYNALCARSVFPTLVYRVFDRKTGRPVL